MGFLRAGAAVIAALPLACSPGVVDTAPWPDAPRTATAPLVVVDVAVESQSRATGGSVLAVAVVTQGSAERARLGCRLKRGDEVVAEATTDFAPAGTTSTRFALWRADGWPAGAYRLEVDLDGRAAAARDVRVGGGS